MLLASTTDIEGLRVKIGARSGYGADEAEHPACPLWLIFLQQASAGLVGPWLNGWRGPLSAPPGALLLIRHADYQAFQRAAPDLVSFVGPRVYEAEGMLSVASPDVVSRLDIALPINILDILGQLPGSLPPPGELDQWIGEMA
jgi:hypothetical protein